MKNVLNQEHRGEVAVETIILIPLIFLTFVFLLYFFFMGCSYMLFNNQANTVAMEMNARATGMLSSPIVYPNFKTSTTMNEGTYDARSKEFDLNNITFVNGSTTTHGTADNGLLMPTSMYILDKYKDGFNVPFNELTAIKITSSNNLSKAYKDSGTKYIGTLISVEISFKPSLFFGLISPIIKCTGYSIIT